MTSCSTPCGANSDTFVFEKATAFTAMATVTDFSTANGGKLDFHDILGCSAGIYTGN